ncbi:chloride channel protein [Candidatus Bathyarchaeota archaeon]|nr:chloride channel protein [Candidatus Bathyarchaeota archaeon]
MSRRLASVADWVKGYLSPDLLNDYLRLAGVSVAMGLIIGFATVSIHEFYQLFHEAAEHLTHASRVFVVLLPVAGLTVAYLVVTRYSTTKQSGGGSHRLLEAYHYEGGIMTAKDTVFEPLASAITIGAGGSAGFEGPSLLLGGGIGSLIAQRLNLEQDEIKRFLISGAAAGVAAIFKAPLTGIMFGLEIPYRRDLSRKAFIPATLASISAYFVSVSFLGTETIFPLIPTFSVPDPLSLIHAFLIGVITAVFGAVFVRMLETVKEVKEDMKVNPLLIPAVGGILVGVVALFLPQVTGIGYETVEEIVSGRSGDWSTGLLLALIFFKMLLTCITLSSGGSGGVFVPSLYVGAALGALYIRFIPVPDEQVLIVAAMASIIASANKTLLTSVSFVAETAGPSSIIFTLIASATSYFISRDVSFYEHVQPVNQMQEQEEAVHVLYHLIKKQKNQIDFKTIKVSQFMNTEPVALKESVKVREALEAVQGCRNREYPVTRRNRVIGQTTLEDLLTFPENKRMLQIGLLPMEHPEVLTADDTLDDAVRLLMDGEGDCIWIVDDRERMRLVGVITETDIMVRLLEAV